MVWVSFDSSVVPAWVWWQAGGLVGLLGVFYLIKRVIRAVRLIGGRHK